MITPLIHMFPVTLTDITTLTPILLLMGFLFYFSNREIRRSLEHSRTAAYIFEKDRDRFKEMFTQSENELTTMRLTRLQELAKAAEFGRLSQGIFHDLMTPLTSIILHTEKLKETALEKHHIEKAVEASQRMAIYIKDLRTTLSREESERDCDLTKELESVLHLLTFIAREKRVEIGVENAEPIHIYSSPTKLRQIFSNLISNALDSFDTLKDTRARKILIRIIKTNGLIHIAVSDNGSGIDPKILLQVFEPFFTTKTEDKGTGIGLTTVKNIVEKHFHGQITVESAIGRGTTLLITFPEGYRDLAASLQHQ